jgi:hypothetical protein
MMLSCVLVLALQPGADPGSATTTAELRALAEEHADAGRFVEAGEAYLQLARRPDVRLRDELFEAHSNFDSAFQASGDSRQLCRALRIAERVVGEGTFDHDEQQKFWAEILDEDLARLAEDAIEKKTGNCRFDAAGRRLEPIALIADDDPPRVPAGHVETASPAVPPPPGPTPRDARRMRARTAGGGALLGLGLGFIGLTTGAVVLHGIQLVALDRLRDGAPARGGLTDEEKSFVSRLSADALESRAAAIGLGVAAAATFIPGVVLLARRHRVWRRDVALVPHGGPRGVGAVLRLNF